jgi:hypothetical protein
VANNLEALNRQIAGLTNSDADLATLRQLLATCRAGDAQPAVLDLLHGTLYSLSRSRAGSVDDKAKVDALLGTLSQWIADRPDDPYPLIAAGELILNFGDDLSAAREHVDRAVALAENSGDFFRQAQGLRIRIALKEGDVPTIERSLVALIAWKRPAGAVDVAPEVGFLRRVKEIGVTASLIADYERVVASR